MSTKSFLQFWWTDKARDAFLSSVPKDDLATLRLACHDFSVRAAPLLFKDITVTFRSTIFTKPVRMAALGRIGHLIRNLRFSMPHGAETFLPPLLDPQTGEEVAFTYQPYVNSGKDPTTRMSIPTYGSLELTDLLVKQYSPLFHAAANVPSFIRFFSAIPQLRHLKISTPGQEPNQRYRRSIVDYALVSLRISVERSKLPALRALTLSPVHPGAVHYLNPIMGFGAIPSSTKPWKQIRKLTIHMDAISIGAPADHLKLLHAYLCVFAPSLRTFKFRWIGAQGPCPLSLDTKALLLPGHLFPAHAKNHPSSLRPIHFQRLQRLEVENTMLDASQVSSFISSNSHTLRDFKSDTDLRNGTWDEALAPLSKISGNDEWKETAEEVMDVPIMLSPTNFGEEELHKIVVNQMRLRNMTPLQDALHKAGTKGKEILFGAEEHMRRSLRTSIFTWR